MAQDISAFEGSDRTTPLFYDFEVEGPWLIRPGRFARTVHGFGGISSDKWGHMLRHAKRRGITVCLSAQDAWGIYLSQGGSCALSGEPIWFSPGDQLGGAVWLARRISDDPDAVPQQKTNTAWTASLDRIDSGGGYTFGNVHWIHKRIQGMKMKLTEVDFIDWCRRIAGYRNRDGS